MTNKTIFDAYSEFQLANPNVNKSVLRSVLHRFFSEQWGGQAPLGSKATNEEVYAFREIMKKTSAHIIATTATPEMLEEQFEKKGVDKKNRKSYRSAYKSFFNWAEANNYFEIHVEPKIKSVENVNPFGSRNPKGMGTKVRGGNHNITYKKTYTLMAKHNNSTRERMGALIYEKDYINDNLRDELKQFQQFREKNNCSKGTLAKDMTIIYRILGWLHRYKNVSLESLSLTSIITFTPLNVDCTKFEDKKGKVNEQKYISEKIKVRQKAVDAANANKKLVEEYINFLDGHPGSKLIAVVTCVAVAKFVFREEVGTDEYMDNTELPIIKRLNQLVKILNESFKNAPPAVSYADKSIPWLEAMDVLQILRARIHCSFIEYKRIYKTEKGEVSRVQKRKREKKSIMNDLQIFLSLALMMLIPTDRARTYYELELGKTFVYGLYENNKFTPFDKLKNKDEAIWYIHLMPDDYKTGKTYKEYWGLVLDVRFGKDSTLYQYIDMWINEGRDFEQKCNHNYFFRGAKNYKPLNSEDWYSRIRQIFEQETGVPVTPKELRKMFVTHLNNIGASKAVMDGAAYSMHHSKKMQEQDYNSQTILDRIRPIYELNEKMHKEFFGENTEDED